MRRRIGTSYNKQSTSDTTSDMIVSVNRQITVCTCWQTWSRALLALAGPGLSLVWNETYFVDAIVTHLYQAHVYIIVVDILLLSVSLSERRRQRMFSNPSAVSKHYRSDGSLTDSDYNVCLDIPCMCRRDCSRSRGLFPTGQISDRWYATPSLFSTGQIADRW